MFARDHAAQFPCQMHDARYRGIGFLQHGVVVRIDRQIGVHVAVTGVHVQCHEHAAFQDLFVQTVAGIQYRLVFPADKNALQFLAYFAFPRHAQGVILQSLEHSGVTIGCDQVGIGDSEIGAGRWRIQVVQQPAPAQTGFFQQSQCATAAFLGHLRVGDRILILKQG